MVKLLETKFNSMLQKPNERLLMNFFSRIPVCFFVNVWFIYCKEKLQAEELFDMMKVTLLDVGLNI